MTVAIWSSVHRQSMNKYRNASQFLKTTHSARSHLLFCTDALRDTVERFREGFPGETSYAVKANPQSNVLRALNDFGINEFDAASLGEIAQIYELLPSAKINYNNPIRTFSDLEAAYHEFGVRSFVVDDRQGLQQLLMLGGGDIEVSVRLKLAHQNAAYDFGSKFGAHPQAAAELLKTASGADSIACVSMAFHPGSQCTNVDVYCQYIDACSATAKSADVTLHRLNIGGGFPLQYVGTQVPALEQYFESISEQLATAFGNNQPFALCEPGRALVGPCCSLMCEVIHVRENGDVFLSDGVYGSLQEQFLIDSQLPLKVWRDGIVRTVEGPRRNVFGPTCDPSDKLATQYQLTHDIAIGDFVEFGLMGAYGSATATHFNGIAPASYALVEQGFSGAKE